MVDMVTLGSFLGSTALMSGRARAPVPSDLLLRFGGIALVSKRVHILGGAGDENKSASVTIRRDARQEEARRQVQGEAQSEAQAQGAEAPPRAGRSDVPCPRQDDLDGIHTLLVGREQRRPCICCPRRPCRRGRPFHRAFCKTRRGGVGRRPRTQGDVGGTDRGRRCEKQSRFGGAGGHERDPEETLNGFYM